MRGIPLVAVFVVLVAVGAPCVPVGAAPHVLLDTPFDSIPIARRLGRGFVQDVFRPPSRR